MGILSESFGRRKSYLADTGFGTVLRGTASTNYVIKVAKLYWSYNQSHLPEVHTLKFTTGGFSPAQRL